MKNCRDNAIMLGKGLEETGKFEIVSKEIGVPLVAFSLKDTSKYTVFNIADNLRRFGWIVPAYTMAPDAEHVAVLRVVVREDFNRSLAERLLSDIGKVIEELDGLHSQATNKATHVTATVDETDGKLLKKKEIAMYWKKIADRTKTSGVC